ncbi:MAG: hypothetical protein HYU99_11670 [Deltaproteobacteria bacterium]|nr:hypothetical protein [Deltaproteobacteria bacterium]
MKKAILTIVAVVGFAGLAVASPANRTLLINGQRDYANAMGASAEVPQRWQHLNRFARDNAEKGSLAGTELPTVENQDQPKNYRNNLNNF